MLQHILIARWPERGRRRREVRAIKGGRLATLQVRLVLMSLLVLIPAAGLILFSNMVERRTAIRHAELDAMKIAQALAADHNRLVTAAHDLLCTLAQLPAVRQGNTECNMLLAQLFRIFDRYTEVTVATPDGTVVCASISWDGPPNIADQLHFQRALRARRFAIGEYLITRLSWKPTLFVALPVLDAESGVVQAVITTGLDLSWLNTLVPGYVLPTGTMVTLLDSQGIVLAQSPDPVSWLSKPLPVEPLRTAIMAAQGPGTIEATGVDSMQHLYAFVPMGAQHNNGNVYLSISIPRSVIVAVAERTFLQQLLMLGVTAVVVLAIAWIATGRLVHRPVQTLIHAARQLGAGDLTMRSGPPYPPGELGQLAHAFDDMATAMAQASDARQQAEAALAQRAAELERSNTDLEQFAYVASHDLHEPLRKVASFTKVLAQQYQGRLDTQAEKDITYIVDGATRMQQMIQDLLTYSRAGRTENTLEPLSMEAVLEETLATLAPAMQESGAEITHTALPTVLAHPTQMRQLFQNLLGNALKFRGDQPLRVHVAAAQREQNWVFAVQDNGIGLDRQYAERIFVLFQRLHGIGTYPGTGIGLALCKKIVERHGGRIWVESQPGHGATFFFTLP
jgi:signal transduction histidine kinase